MQKTRDIEIDEIGIFKNDLLDRQTEIKNLTPIILNFDDSLVVALDSPWGAGKTTFVRLWQAYLKQQGKQSIYFNAWETDYAADPLIVLVSELDKWLRANGNESVADEVLKKSKKVLISIAKQTAIAAVKIGTLNAVDGEQFDRVISDATGAITGDLIDNFNKQSEAIKLFKEDIIPKMLNALPSGQKNLVIFIDELDRCRPTYAIELLERIKHLFSINHLAFVLSTDTNQLAHSIRAVYGNDFDAKKYLQRFIDLDYSLKRPSQQLYIDSQFKLLGIQKEFEDAGNRQTENDLRKCLFFLAKRFNLELRDINLLLMRIRLILYSIPKDHFLDEYLLITLLVLRDQDKGLYDRYVSSPSVADKVIDFLCKGFLPLKINNEFGGTISQIIGNLIAPNWREDRQNEEFYRLIEPYRSQVKSIPGDINRSVVCFAENPRGDTFPFFRSEVLKVAVERIELVQQINIEI